MPLDVDLLQPIDEASPGGSSVRYEPVFDQIKQARIEEEDIPQGEWKRARKTADWAAVVRLSTEVLRDRSKDLQVAAWLTEGLVHREGYGGLRQGLDLIRGFLEAFWDHLYPQVDDGDLEFRASPLEWVGRYLEIPVRSVAVSASGHDFLAYKESRAVGYEEDAEKDGTRKAAREAAIREGKLTAEEFDEGFASTPKAFYKALVADLDACLEALEALDAVCAERFGEVAPSYLTLRDALQEVRGVAGQLLARKLETDPDPPGAEDAAPAAAGAAAPEGDDVMAPTEGGAGGVPSPGTGGASVVGVQPAPAVAGPPSSREDAAARVAAAARYMRGDRPTDPAPYLMLRGLRWGELRGRGGEIDPRLLTAPPTDVRTRLKGLLLDGKWAELVEASEEVMATTHGRGWLDLQRYFLMGCDGLGSEYDVVGSAVRGALRQLLRDLSRLLELTLMDDTPTANRETLDWLRDEGLLPAPDDPAAEAQAAAREEARARPGRGTVERALERARAGQPHKAIEMLLKEAEQQKSPRSSFLHRSQAARVMVEAGLEEVAVPILKEMLQEVEDHKLEEWEEGETVALPLGLLWRCLEKTGGDADTRQNLYRRVARLDPLQAIRFSGRTGGEQGSGPDGQA